MTPTIIPQAFVAKWQQATLRERALSQEHFIDLCRLIGHPMPAEADPAGKWFTFEAGATTASLPADPRGCWPRVKRLCRRLEDGPFRVGVQGPARQPRQGLRPAPPVSRIPSYPLLLIVSDMQRIVIHTNFTNTAKQTHNLALEDLLDPARLEILRQAFTDPDVLRPARPRSR